MASNFDFLHTHYPQLFEHAAHAESLVYTAPRASCFYTRFTLEQAVHWLYANDPYLQLPYDSNLAALIHEQTFQNNLKPGLFPKIRAIHKMGNIAVHDSTSITEKDALHLVQELFHFLYWFYRSYAPDGKTIPSLNFERHFIPHSNASATPDLSLPQLQGLETKLSQADEMRRIPITTTKCDHITAAIIGSIKFMDLWGQRFFLVTALSNAEVKTDSPSPSYVISG